MLIHGFGDGAYVWCDFVRHLPTGYRAFAVDLRGHGHSPRSADGLYFTQQHVLDVVSTLDSLGLDRVVLVGHSLGGDIALRIAIEQPRRVAALVVVDFAIGTRSTGFRIIADLADSMRQYATTDEYLQWLMRVRPLASIQLLKHCAEQALEGSPETGYRPRIDRRIYSYRNAPHRSAKLDWSMLPHVLCPTLILRGASSSVLPRSVAERMAATVPNCTLREVSRSGHAIMLDNPVVFREYVSEFLGSLGDPPGSR